MSEIQQYRAYLEAIILALALQIRSLDDPSPQALQTAASLISLWAQFGFQSLVTDPMDEKLGAANILVSLIRLVRLQNPRTASEDEELPDV